MRKERAVHQEKEGERARGKQRHGSQQKQRTAILREQFEKPCVFIRRSTIDYRPLPGP